MAPTDATLPDPGRPELPAGLPADLAARARVGGDGLLWVSPALADDEPRLRERGCRPARLVLQLRCDLPLDASAGSPAACRPFRPGRDDDEFLDVNHRAFEWHPEQGDLDAEGLAARLAAPWFSADGFLVHTDAAGRIDGYCWTKVHPPSGDEPALGEIYVVARDPALTVRGLGRALVVAGLDHLSRQTVDGTALAVGMLYVESTNDVAVGLYSSLGFTLHHTDAAYALPGAPA
ncbi:MAG: GNAT family N-acetyltransferase [Actinomycetes bacterium]